MEHDPTNPTGISPSVALCAMQQRTDDQRSRVRRLLRPHRRPTSTGRQGQPTSTHAHLVREPARAWDHIRFGVARIPQAAAARIPPIGPTRAHGEARVAVESAR